MAPIALAFALFLQAQPAAADPVGILLGTPAQEGAAQPPAAETPPPEGAQPPEGAPEDHLPPGAPHDDYQFVSWCYGNLRGYLDLHDRVMPEVTRIETTYRPPDRKLSDDLKVYADMQKAGRAQLKTFQAAMTAAEKASLKPINIVGGQAVIKGRSIWEVTPDVTPARLAQEWMSWALPARCETVAKDLQARATLLGASFKANDEAEPPPAPDAPAPPAPDAATAPPADAPPAPKETPQAAPQ